MVVEKKCKLKYLKIGDTFTYRNKEWIVLDNLMGDFFLCGRFFDNTYKVLKRKIDRDFFVYINKNYYNLKICSTYVQDKIKRN